MGSRYLTDLANVCRNAGLTVQEEPGWQTRARGSGGYNSGYPNHVMVHHTASGKSSDGQPDVNYMCYSDSDRPLANLYLNRAGKVWIMAAGATNTNGSGRDPCGAIANDSMNSSAIGIEAGNDGVGEPWPTAQQDAYVKLCKALCDHYGIPNNRIHAHFEWAPDRKVDNAGPSRWSNPSGGGGGNKWRMNDFRASVASGGGGGGGGGKGDTMLQLFRISDAHQNTVHYVSDGMTYHAVPNGDAEAVIILFQTKAGADPRTYTLQNCTKAQLGWAGAYRDLHSGQFTDNPYL
jgi:hypothetical protein